MRGEGTMAWEKYGERRYYYRSVRRDGKVKKIYYGAGPAALPCIRDILHRHPEVWRHVGDLATLAERAWIAVLAADHPVAVESMKRTVAEMKAELAGDNATRIERLLVDQVVACWMEVS